MCFAAFFFFFSHQSAIVSVVMAHFSLCKYRYPVFWNKTVKKTNWQDVTFAPSIILLDRLDSILFNRKNIFYILPITNNSTHFKMTFWIENTFNSRTCHVSEKMPSSPGRWLEKDRQVQSRSDPVHLGPDPDPKIRYPESWILIRILPSNLLNTVPLPTIVLSVLVWK